MMTEPLGIVDIVTILLVTIGPLKALIVYASLTAEADVEFRREVAVRTVKTAAIVSLVFVLAGEILLGIFHVSLPALKIAGGIILLLFAIGMVMGGGHGDEEGKPKSLSLDIAVYPLAIPMMATPQGLVALTAITAAQPNLLWVGVMALIVLAIMALNLACLLSADRIIKAIGPSGLQIIARVAGVLLSALAVQLMILGFRDLGLIDAALVH
ncbi:MAG: MarC family protein [Geminicoccaceae bacterium]